MRETSFQISLSLPIIALEADTAGHYRSTYRRL